MAAQPGGPTWLCIPKLGHEAILEGLECACQSCSGSGIFALQAEATARIKGLSVEVMARAAVAHCHQQVLQHIICCSLLLFPV